ncbi:MAG: RNA-directed DNA polymerase [Labilibaculum sp.]|nr:reverse transcriptase domain-containing protein [Labilibaculum sp.]MBI9060288.1 RNA-directed DNA polymerase [Labilibaculum sp.]
MKKERINTVNDWNKLNKLSGNKEILSHLYKILSRFADTLKNEIIAEIEKKNKPKAEQIKLSKWSISIDRLLYLSGQDNLKKQYHKVEIPKKRGGVRILNIPSKKLRFVQRLLLDFLSENFETHKCAYGFVKGKSIVDNAKLHVNKKHVVCYDIKDFFPSITGRRIYGMLQQYPFNANKDVARIIANIATYYDDEKSEKILPQGSPTSPYLANMICRKMDSRIFNFFKEKNIHYTRYADDLTFSTNDSKKIELILKNVPRFIKEEGFELNNSKTRVQNYYKRQIVTGIIVNKKISLPREYIRGLRALLHNVEKYGWESQVNRKIISFESDDYLKFINFQKETNNEEENKKLQKLTKSKFDEYNKTQNNEHKLIHGKNYIDLRLKSQKYPSQRYTQVDMMKEIIKGKIEFWGMVRNIRDKEGKIIKTDNTYKNLKDEFELLNLMQRKEDVQYIKVSRKFENIIKSYENNKSIDEKTKKEIIDNINSLKKLKNENLSEIVKNMVSPILHNPKRTSEILIKFHKDDNVLKYTNHDWDKEDDNMKFLTN